MFIFFPALHETCDYEHTTFLNKDDQQLWLDAILLLAVYKVIGSSNILQHYPKALADSLRRHLLWAHDVANLE
jgi:hypothetical protein